MFCDAVEHPPGMLHCMHPRCPMRPTRRSLARVGGEERDGGRKEGRRGGKERRGGEGGMRSREGRRDGEGKRGGRKREGGMRDRWRREKNIRF